MRVVLSILLLLFLYSFVQAEKAVFTRSLEDAVAFSEDTGKDLLVIFTADWCVNCTAMKTDIESDDKILDDMIVCYVDIDDRKDLKKEYRVKLIPDYLILRKKIEIKRKVGYTNKDSFIKWLRNDK